MPENKQEVAVKKSGGELQRESSRYLSPFEEMEHMFEDFFNRRFFAPTWMPRLPFNGLGDMSTSVDMFEDGADLVIKAEMPGMKKEEISIDFSGDVVTISGEKKSEEKTERKDYYRVERSFGSFCRKLSLPVEIQIDKATASFMDGVLELRMPKSESGKNNVRKITVQ
ncbi:MAG: Hsp20/alpha crystallin family protein [Desulfuromonadaceae bacterium]|nr:Hsp20/alpha crystallin family protein [Desulfuromonadaceae bacterium]